MSVAKLKKLSLVGRIAEKDGALARLQTLGAMHLVQLSPKETHPEKIVSREAEEAYKALHFLSAVPKPRRQVRSDPAFDVHAFVKKILALRADLRTARDKRDFLVHRIATLRPWGDFIFPPKEAMAGLRLWFYQLPHKQRESLLTVELPWQIVGEDHQFAYVVLIAKDEPALDVLPVPRRHTGDKPIEVLEVELDETEIEIESLQGDRMAQTRFLGLLRASLSEAETAAELSFAQTQTLDDDELFAVQGWVPEDRMTEVEQACDDLGLAVLIEDPGWDEVPPTLLEQPETEAAGVDLAMFYQVPHYRGWDPTLMLIVSFAIFFAMIIADAGYGVVILLGLLAFWKRLGGDTHMKAWRRLGLILAGCTIAYGVIVGSCFGAAPPDGSLFSSLAILDLNDFETMMQISIIVGVAHIAFANFMAFRVNHKRSRHANLGWIAALCGGLLIWLSGQIGHVFTAGIALAIGGLIAIVAFTSERPVAKPSDWAWRIFDGVKRLSGLMGAFGDVLSYMRLFALGLASASLALTFNDLATDVMASKSGLGILGGLLILLIGHVLNFGLGLMSGVVHGLRLNYIEFFKWGLPEEGVAFRAFARKEVQE
ncbi:V-type ATP synthase subunit I [uncultured Hoeflea sp.]|uniref:V-type ATP synthase subunit I n=1 Tax=uncultured Hoeflea sp. TaxID=538666 RepID=UPI00260C9771|nr:V-type ATP synthase subunit I [uncultured Hoeflea sp.]